MVHFLFSTGFCFLNFRGFFFKVKEKFGFYVSSFSKSYQANFLKALLLCASSLSPKRKANFLYMSQYIPILPKPNLTTLSICLLLKKRE